MLLLQKLPQHLFIFETFCLCIEDAMGNEKVASYFIIYFTTDRLSNRRTAVLQLSFLAFTFAQNVFNFSIGTG
jgi:hypothetical protein